MARPGWQDDAMGRTRAVALISAAGITLALVVMVGRVVQLQTRPSEALRSQLDPRLTTRVEPGLRGDLLDRRGRVLSATRYGYRAVVDPLLIAGEKDGPDTVIAALAQVSGKPADQIAKRIFDAIEKNQLRQKLWDEYNASQTPVGSPLERLMAMLSGKARSVAGSSAQHSAEQLPATGSEPNSEPGADESPDAAADGERPPKLVRYLPVTEVLTDEQVAALKARKLPGVHLEQRQVREYVAGNEVASVLGKVGWENAGLMGAEKKLNRQLTGTPGELTYVHDAWGRPLWVEPGRIKPTATGEDVRLSVDLELQRIAYQELERGVEECDAAGGRLVMLDPITGEILAMVDIVRPVKDAIPFPWAPALKKDKRGRLIGKDDAKPAPPARYITLKADTNRAQSAALGRNRCVEDIYEPGSTFKPFIWSTITELGLARPDEVFDTEGGRWATSYGRPIQDVVKRATMKWTEVLINSSNIGMIKGAERLTFKQLHDVPVRYGFGKVTGLGLPGEATGLVTPLKSWSKYSQTSVAYGHEIAVTPVQMVRAFSVFARPGELAGTIPQLRLTAATSEDADLGILDRVLPADVARLTKETMKGVAVNMENKLAAGKSHETGWRYSMFGKSGTAEIPLGKAPDGKRRPPGSTGYFDNQYNSSFIAGAPGDTPRIVVICVIDDPGPQRVRTRTHYGALTAGPVVRRVVERSLTYLGVPPDVDPNSVAQQVANAE
jgi:cell division protein FtsI (penicillin-binding protein 3)